MGAQPAMARVLPWVVPLMARTTLRPLPGCGCELRCPPDYEARILSSIPAFAHLVDPHSFPLPVKVIGADPHLDHSFIPPCVLRPTVSPDFESVPETTHLAQLEKPDECARLTVEVLSRVGFGGR